MGRRSDGENWPSADRREGDRSVRMRQWSQRRRLGVVLALNLSLIAGLIVAGLAAHSISVLAAAGDTAADSVALILGLVAVAIRDRTDGDPSRSKATTFVAIINGAWLLMVTGFVAVTALHRLRAGSPEVHGVPMLVMSAISAVVLLLGAWVLGERAAAEDLHMRSVLLDTLADAAAAGAVALAGTVIAVTGRFYWLDSVVALVIGVVIAAAAVKLLYDGVRALRGAELVIDDD